VKVKQRTYLTSRPRTVNDLIRQVSEGLVSPEDASRLVDEDKRMTYGIRYFDTRLGGLTDKETEAYDSIYGEWEKLQDQKEASQTPPERPESEMIQCSCGHTVARSQVMSANLGTSCPECYDRLSGDE